jgi:hypothetical protein
MYEVFGSRAPCTVGSLLQGDLGRCRIRVRMAQQATTALVDEQDGEGEVVASDGKALLGVVVGEVAEVARHELDEAQAGPVNGVDEGEPIIGLLQSFLRIEEKPGEVVLVQREGIDGGKEDVGDGIAEADGEAALREAAGEVRDVGDGKAAGRIQVELGHLMEALLHERIHRGHGVAGLRVPEGPAGRAVAGKGIIGHGSALGFASSVSIWVSILFADRYIIIYWRV